MAEVTRRTYRITLEVTASVREIDQADEALASAGRGRPGGDPMRREWLERDRRLLAALLGNPEALSGLLRRRALDELDPLTPTADGSLEALCARQLADADLIERLRDVLPADDHRFYRDVCEEGLFYDNSMHFQDAMAAEISRIRIEDLSDASMVGGNGNTGNDEARPPDGDPT